LANKRPFWFYPEGKFKKNEIHFLNYRGGKIRRQLIGYSNKRGVHWHFAIIPRYQPSSRSYSITPHVTFSTNGKDPLASKAYLHSLRRSFCRSWWNNRWRDLLQAFVASLADGKDQIELDVGCEEPIVISARFNTISSPISPIIYSGVLETDVIDDVQDD